MRKTLYSVQVLGATVALYNGNNLEQALNMRERWFAQLGCDKTVILVDNETGEIVAGSNPSGGRGEIKMKYNLCIMAATLDGEIKTAKATLEAANSAEAIEQAFATYMDGWVDEDNLRGITFVVTYKGDIVFTMCEGVVLFPHTISAEALETAWIKKAML